MSEPNSSSPTPPTAAAGVFRTTHWSVVLSAGDRPSPHAQQALTTLCQIYWYPLYAFVRRQGHSPHDAQDLTQEFFARLLQSHFFAGLSGVIGQLRKVEAAARLLHHNLYVADMAIAHRAYVENNLGRAVELLRKYVPRPGEPDLRGFEWRYLWQLTRGTERCTFLHEAFVEAVEFSPNGQWLASLGRDRCVRIWNPITRQSLTNLTGVDVPPSHDVTLFFSPDSRFLAASIPGGASTNQLWIWDTSTWAQVALLPEVKLPAFFTPDSQSLISRVTGSAVAWDTTTWKPRPEPPPAFTRLGRYCMRPTGGRFLCASGENGRYQIWDLVDGVLRCEVTLLLEPSWGGPVAFTINHDATRLAMANWQGEARLHELPSGRLQTNWAAHTSPIFGLRFSPDDQTLATGGFDQVVHLWEVATCARRGTLRGHYSEVWTVAFSPDGQLVASGGKDTTVRLWPAVVESHANTLTNAVVPIGFVKEGTQLAATKAQRTVGCWDIRSRQELATLALEGYSPKDATAVSLASDGRTVVCGAPSKVRHGCGASARQRPN
jgi:WD40 repeat protein